MPNPEIPTLDVFADVGCPFTYVGLRHIIRAREKRGSSVRLVVRAWPLELVNARPFDLEDLSAEITALRAQVESDMFTGFDASTFPKTSIPAFGLAHVAYQQDVVTGETVSMELREAIFEHGLDVSAPEVLADIARRHGLTVPGIEDARAMVHSEWEEGQRRGVIGSPHFLLPNGEGAFCPGLKISRRDDGSFDIEPDMATMSGFFAEVFALG